MIVDSSAVIAILRREEGFEDLMLAMGRADHLSVGAPTLVEIGMVLRGRFGLDPVPVIERFLETFEIEVVPFDESHWRESVKAFEDFGKGRHPAALNFGDCLAFSVARKQGEPLLFVGDDFSRTDLDSVTTS